ncbi:MAG: endonuclease NucS domain-containing protein [Dehalococcoidia bacterium]
MAVWELIREAMDSAHGRGRDWLTVGEITREVLAIDQAVNRGTIHGYVRYLCINDPSKKHSAARQYRSNPLLVTDDPTMHGKRYRLLTEHERTVFLANVRDDLESVSYAQLMEWLNDPSLALEPQAVEFSEGEEAEVSEDIGGPALLEIHLQDYVFRNWKAVFPDLALFQGAGGREFRTQDPSVGIIDFLCTDKKGDFVVIETKRETPDRQAIGQVLGYMGWVRQRLCTKGQSVRGILIANEVSDQLKLAAAVIPDLALYCYEISFNVRPAES